MAEKNSDAMAAMAIAERLNEMLDRASLRIIAAGWMPPAIHINRDLESGTFKISLGSATPTDPKGVLVYEVAIALALKPTIALEPRERWVEDPIPRPGTNTQDGKSLLEIVVRERLHHAVDAQLLAMLGHDIVRDQQLCGIAHARQQIVAHLDKHFRAGSLTTEILSRADAEHMRLCIEAARVRTIALRGSF